jgi:hypothetical protein
LIFVIKMVNDSLEETRDLRDDDLGESKLSALANASGMLVAYVVNLLSTLCLI